MTFILDNLRKAVVVRVHNLSRIECCLDLGFGVSLNHSFSMLGFDPKLVPDEQRREAVHALVVLIGGKNVLLEPESDKPNVKSARIYLNERVYGTPVGYVANVPKLPRPILDVAMFMEWLSGVGFDAKRAREVIRGNRNTVSAEGS